MAVAQKSGGTQEGLSDCFLYYLVALHGEDLHHHVRKVFTLIVIAPHDLLESGIDNYEIVQYLHAEDVSNHKAAYMTIDAPTGPIMHFGSRP